eukprot:COSAG02_NODE_6931_length_3283_cov_2.278894_4_plen_178_part_00
MADLTSHRNACTVRAKSTSSSRIFRPHYNTAPKSHTRRMWAVYRIIGIGAKCIHSRNDHPYFVYSRQPVGPCFPFSLSSSPWAAELVCRSSRHPRDSEREEKDVREQKVEGWGRENDIAGRSTCMSWWIDGEEPAGLRRCLLFQCPLDAALSTCADSLHIRLSDGAHHCRVRTQNNK